MTRRMRVLHVGKFYPPHMGGMESHVETLARELRGEVDVQVLVSSDGRQTIRENIDGIPVTFTNVSAERLVRGTWFTAR